MKILQLLEAINQPILLENRLDFLRTKFLPKMQSQLYADQNINRDTGIDKDNLFELFVNADPTTNKKFTQWLITIYITGNLRLEDLYKATEYLTVFIKNMRALPQEKRDISTYKSLQELYRTIKEYVGNDVVSNRQREKQLRELMHTSKHIVLAYDSPTMKVVIPKSQEASCYFGRNTQWCTAATTSENQFPYYSQHGTLLIVIIKNEDTRFQIYFEDEDTVGLRTLEIMDENDFPISISQIHEDYPEIEQALGEDELFMLYDLESDNNPEEVDWDAEGVFESYNTLLEDRMDHLVKTFQEKILAKLQSEHERGINDWHKAESVFQHFVDTDPTPQKKYVQWLIKLYLTDNLKLEDLFRAQEYLTTFETNKAAIPEELRNIHKYGSIQELYKVTRQYKNVDVSKRQVSKKYKELMHSDSQVEIVYDSPTMKVVIPKTEAASCYFGRNTQWCTAATSANNMFDSYNKRGDLYIILIKEDNLRYQVFVSDNVQYGSIDVSGNDIEMMDENDATLDFNEFVFDYPEIEDALGLDLSEHLVVTSQELNRGSSWDWEQSEDERMEQEDDEDTWDND